MVPEEHLVAQGVDVFEPQEGHLQSLIQPLVQRQCFSRNELKHLAGNAMHQATVASVVLYTLSTLRRLPRGKPRSLNLVPDDQDGTEAESQGSQGQRPPQPTRRADSMISDGSQLEM